MPLTPKGYCDQGKITGMFFTENLAEMPLTPKGYCDAEGVSDDFAFFAH